MITTAWLSYHKYFYYAIANRSQNKKFQKFIYDFQKQWYDIGTMMFVTRKGMVNDGKLLSA